MKVKLNHYKINLLFHCFSKVHKVLIDNVYLFCLVDRNISESLKNFSHNDIENFVNLNKILEK